MYLGTQSFVLHSSKNLSLHLDFERDLMSLVNFTKQSLMLVLYVEVTLLKASMREILGRKFSKFKSEDSLVVRSAQDCSKSRGEASVVGCATVLLSRRRLDGGGPRRGR